jgi:glycosyltransferase involved in cell wall biosynthesis
MVEHGISRSRIFRFPYLVDEDTLLRIHSAAAGRRSRLRAQYGIREDAFVVLGVMKFVEREDPLTLMRGFSRFASSRRGEAPVRREIALVLVGDGELKPEIQALCPAGAGVSVALPGYVPYTKLPEFFAIADVLVHSARGESWGVTVNEALVCGLPVLAADNVGSARDLIRDGSEGYSFETGNDAALADLLWRLYKDPASLERMRERCASSEALVPFTYASVRDNLTRALDFVRGAASVAHGSD